MAEANPLSRPAPHPPPPRSSFPFLPRKLPSRNWLIFWTLAASTGTALIYDGREKRRATRRWARAVSHLADEPVANPHALPRKLTIYLSAPPGDGLRVAQDHYIEYVKPVLGASGLDWEFVQGRREGDVRAVVAERIRRMRGKSGEGSLGRTKEEEEEKEQQQPTNEEIIETVRLRHQVPEYDGLRGDIVIGRHTWKEYIRGLHEGWLGPLEAPPERKALHALEEQQTATTGETRTDKSEGQNSKDGKDKGPPPRPRQPPPYNSPTDYASESLPFHTPPVFDPAMPLSHPHILGFLSMPTRLARFFARRHLADRIGHDVAAVCLASHRAFRYLPDGSPTETRFEQQLQLRGEEKDWVKRVWKEDDEGDEETRRIECIWTRPMAMDERVATRMRRFELQPGDDARARAIVVPEEEIEGWIKGSLRRGFRWARAKLWRRQEKTDGGAVEEGCRESDGQ